MIEEAVRRLFLEQPSIATAVTTGPRHEQLGVFVDDIPQGAGLACVLIERTDHDPMVCLDGTRGMEMTELAIHCAASTGTLARELAATVSAFFKDYSGSTPTGDTVDSVIWDGQVTTSFDDTGGKRRYFASLSFEVQHS